MTEAGVAAESAGVRPFEGWTATLDLLPCMAFVVRLGRIVAQNGAACAATGRAPDAACALEEIFLGTFPDAVVRAEAAAIPFDFECLLVRAGGRPLAVLGGVRAVDADTQLVLVMRRPGGEDASASTFLGDLLDSAPEAMAITHEGRLLHVNREFTQVFGFAFDACVGRELNDLVLPEGRSYENEILEHMVAVDGRASLETVRRTRAGAYVDVSLLMAPVRLSGTAMGRFHTFRDIGRQKQEEARMQHDAMHDPMTGLANRAKFLDRLRLTLARLRRRPDRSFAVMFLDLDRFKGVNDSLGHAAGDFLLGEAAARLRVCVRPQDTVARFGGDEFAVLLDEAGQREDVELVARRIQAAVQERMTFEGAEICVSASIGIAHVTSAREDAEEIVRNADLAMYAAKAGGKARHAFAGEAGALAGGMGSAADARMQPCLASPAAKESKA